jgi:hypothetical protein
MAPVHSSLTKMLPWSILGEVNRYRNPGRANEPIQITPSLFSLLSKV